MPRDTYWQDASGTLGKPRDQLAFEMREQGQSYEAIAAQFHRKPEDTRKAIHRYKLRNGMAGHQATAPVDPVEHWKGSLLQQAEKRISSQQIREQAMYSLLSDMLRESLAGMQPISLPPPIVPSTTGDEETACVHISDCQIGQLVTLEHTRGINRYDSNVFCHRARHIVDKIVHLTQLQRYHARIDRLVLFIGGDIVENDTMRASSKNYTDIEIGLQVTLASRVLVDMVLRLLQHFGRVEIHTTKGNHGRIGKPGENHQMSNFDHIVYTIMRDMLYLLVPDESRLLVDVPYSTFTHDEVMGHKFTMVHGEEIKAWMGIPFYGASREKDDLSNLLDWIGEDVDYILIGHHHRFGNWEHGTGEIMMNGSWVGPCNFSINNLRKGARASQNMWFVHPDFGITAKYRLFLDRLPHEVYNEDLLSCYLKPEFARVLNTEIPALV